MSKKNSTLSLLTSVLPLVGDACLLAGVSWAVWTGGFNNAIFALIAVSVLFYVSLFVRAEKANIQYYMHVLVYSLLVGGICVVAYMFADRYTVQKDLTHGQLYSLSDGTVKYLKTLDKEVKITIFTDANEAFENVERLYDAYTNKLKWTFKDPVKDPMLARKLGERVNVGDMFFECGKNKKKVNRAELDPAFIQKPVLAESTFTNSIMEVSRNARPKIYFLTGHGELPMKADDSNADENDPAASQQRRRSTGPSVGKLCDALNGRGIETATLDLASAGKIPDDATAVVIAGPTRDLFDSELTALEDFLKGDPSGSKEAGKLMVLLDPLTGDMQQPITVPNVKKLLAEYGILVNDDVIVDSMSAMLGQSPFYPLLGAMDPRHPITSTVVKAAKGMHSIVTGATRSLARGDVPPSMEFAELIKSSPESWTIEISKLTDHLAPPPKRDMRPQVYGVAVSKTPPPQIPGLALPKQVKNGTRVVAFGSSKLITDQYLAGNNIPTLLMFNAMDWLSTGEEAFTMPSRQAEETPIVLDLGKQRVILLIAVFLIPFALLRGGVSYSVMRRRR